MKKMLTAMARGDWKAASDEMMDSLWARQTSRRAKELADLVGGFAQRTASLSDGVYESNGKIVSVRDGKVESI